MSDRLAILSIVLLLPACLDVTTSDTPPVITGADDSSGSGDSSGSPLGDSGVASDDGHGGGTGTGGGTGPGGSSDTGQGSTGGSTVGECILPTSGSWCAAQREVAQEIGCRTSADPPRCYQTIAAQYTLGDWEAVRLGDCNTQDDGPSCAPLYSACTNAIGPAECDLADPATVNDCQLLAQMSGVDFGLSAAACLAMLAVYG